MNPSHTFIAVKSSGRRPRGIQGPVGVIKTAVDRQ